MYVFSTTGPEAVIVEILEVAVLAVVMVSSATDDFVVVVAIDASVAESSAPDVIVVVICASVVEVSGSITS